MRAISVAEPLNRVQSPAIDGTEQERWSPEMVNNEPETTENDQSVVIADALVEEVSIDGMCGVY